MNFRNSIVFLDLGLVAMWSSGYIGAKMAAETDSVLLVLFWRFLLISIVLLPVAYRHVRAKGYRTFWVNASLGACGMFLQIGGAVLAIDMGMSAGVVSIIYALQPLLTAAIAGPLLGEHVSTREWSGLAIAFIGVTIAAGYGGPSAPIAAYLLTILGTVGMVAATMIAKRSNDDAPLLPAIGIQSVVTTVLFAPFMLADVGFVLPPADVTFWSAVAWFMLFSTLGAYGFYWACLRRSSAVHVGTVLYLTPVVTIATTWAFFGEPLTLPKLGGLLLCLVGVAVSFRVKRPRSAVVV